MHKKIFWILRKSLDNVTVYAKNPIGNSVTTNIFFAYQFDNKYILDNTVTSGKGWEWVSIEITIKEVE